MNTPEYLIEASGTEYIYEYQYLYDQALTLLEINPLATPEDFISFIQGNY